MHALSVKQPWAECIARGFKRIEYRTWKAPRIVGSTLLIVASRTPGEEYMGEPLGVAICTVRVTQITGAPRDFEWHLDEPRRVEPVPIRGYAALYTVDDALIVPERERGPYEVVAGDMVLASGLTVEEFRERARELANVHAMRVEIWRDNHMISYADPEARGRRRA